MKYKATKLIDGFSCCFRQWKADDTHCKYLHGYAIAFKIVFKAEELEHRNWVLDFGFLSRSKTKIDGMNVREWFKYMFDHTTIMAKDDEALSQFKQLDEQGVIQLRILDRVGCEMFARYVFMKLSNFVAEETNHRAQVQSVECLEHNKNSAIYGS